MNYILRITVDVTLGQGTLPNSVQKFILKMRINKRNLERNIISEYPIFEMIRKMHGYENFTQILSKLRPQGSNVPPA